MREGHIMSQKSHHDDRHDIQIQMGYVGTLEWQCHLSKGRKRCSRRVFAAHTISAQLKCALSNQVEQGLWLGNPKHTEKGECVKDNWSVKGSCHI
jgi:hypothetical protein